MAKKLKSEKSKAGTANLSPSSGSIFKKPEIDPTLASLFADSASRNWLHVIAAHN
jgi:hypothetical protein